MTTSNKLTIFEGCDGAGKSTAARRYAHRVGAHYVHLGSFPQVGDALGRLYVEAMMPAVLGHAHVVLDRSWLSEEPYGRVHRKGSDRLGDLDRRLIERLALRCSTAVIWCKPALETCVANYRQRKGEELLESESALREVYHAYDTAMEHCQLPVHVFDYEGQDASMLHTLARTLPHSLKAHTAGNLRAKVLLVGEDFSERKNVDPLYQWPFASFSRLGCSRWVTSELITAGIPERALLWANADMGEVLEELVDGKEVVALGERAYDRMHGLVPSSHLHVCPHPQYHKRFRVKHPYELVAILKELL